MKTTIETGRLIRRCSKLLQGYSDDLIVVRDRSQVCDVITGLDEVAAILDELCMDLAVSGPAPLAVLRRSVAV
jgi:hypothetical protein